MHQNECDSIPFQLKEYYQIVKPVKQEIANLKWSVKMVLLGLHGLLRVDEYYVGIETLGESNPAGEPRFNYGGNH